MHSIKSPTTRCLITIGIYHLPVLEARSLRSPPWGSEEESVHALPSFCNLPETLGDPWFVTLQSLPVSSHGTLSCVSVSSPLLKRTAVILDSELTMFLMTLLPSKITFLGPGKDMTFGERLSKPVHTPILAHLWKLNVSL